MLKPNKLAGAAILTALSLALTLPVWADQTLEELDDPIMVELQTPIQMETATIGKEFSAVLNEDVHYENWVIPAGTRFDGAIARTGRSHPLSRPGYVLLQVHTATLPSGETYDFKPQLYEPRSKRLHNPEAQTFGDTVKQQLPYTAVTLGTSLPLRYGADMNRWVVLPITVGARMVLGAGMALFDDDLAGKNAAQRVGYGLWQGTGIPRAWRFITKDPEPNFQGGEEIPLYFNETALETFFRTAAPESAATVQDRGGVNQSAVQELPEAETEAMQPDALPAASDSIPADDTLDAELPDTEGMEAEDDEGMRPIAVPAVAE